MVADRPARQSRTAEFICACRSAGVERSPALRPGSMTSPGFTGSPLDRADRLRTSPDDYATVRTDPTARLLLLDGLDPVLDGSDLSWAPLAGNIPLDVLVFLGLLDGVPHFAAIPTERHQSSPIAAR